MDKLTGQKHRYLEIQLIGLNIFDQLNWQLNLIIHYN